MTALYAAPVAIPLIWYGEHRTINHPVWYLFTGVVTGSLVLILATITEEIGLKLALTIYSSSLLAALVYWLAAWKVLPPKLTNHPHDKVNQ